MAESPTGAARIYRIGWGQRVFCIVFTGMGLTFLTAFWGGAISGAREASLMELLIPVALVAIGSLFTARAFKNYIALSQSEICLQSIFGSKTLPFDKIRGRRRSLDRGGYESPSTWYLKVEPNDDRFPVLEFEQSYYALDESFFSWFNALPDLDALDKTLPRTSNFGLV